MKKITGKLALLCLLPMLAVNAFAMGQDDPLLGYFKADRLEWSDVDEGDLLVWEIDAWIGRDLDKLWFKASGEALQGAVESQRIDLLYSRAVSAYWDFQVGLRHENRPKPSADWIGFGFMGVAPYLLEIDSSLFINDDDQLSIDIEVEYEYMFSQRLVLVPTLEMTFYSDNDPLRETGSGLSDAELALRLHYEIRRELSPYIGINHERTFGGTADFIETAGGDTSETQLLLGLSFWF